MPKSIQVTSYSIDFHDNCMIRRYIVTLPRPLDAVKVSMTM